jgi:1-acyl-sn-glycerol-3-phosphate acyltransferase
MRVNFWQKWLIIVRLVIVFSFNTFHEVFGALFIKDVQKKRAYASRIVHRWARQTLRVLKVNYSILNPDHFIFEANRPYIIMSNHLSHFDIPLLYVTFPHDVIAMIAKKELFRIPVWGWGMKISGCVSIDRENKYQALKDLKIAEKNMHEGVRIWVAPEGTRSRTGNMGPFKRGGFKIALNVKAIIVPLTIIGSNKILPPGALNFSTGESVDVYVGKPIDTASYELKDLPKLMMNVENAIKLNLK